MPIILLVEKVGTLKTLKTKELKEEELYKKCGFKNATNFGKQHTWSVTHNGNKYKISFYAKTDSRVADRENKYKFPPPIDKCLYFGTCVLVATIFKQDKFGIYEYVDLTVELWTSIYDKLYKNFEPLSIAQNEDEKEVDKLDLIPKNKKTKEGYLKDGFVVDSLSDEEDLDEKYESDDTVCSVNDFDFPEEDEDNSYGSLKMKTSQKKKKQVKQETKTFVINITEELTEEEYL